MKRNLLFLGGGLLLLSCAGCVVSSKAKYGITPGYGAYCWERHDERPIEAGAVYGSMRQWESHLIDTIPKSDRQGLSPMEIGYFTKAQAREQCRIHERDFPGHKCRVRKGGYYYDGLM